MASVNTGRAAEVYATFTVAANAETVGATGGWLAGGVVVPLATLNVREALTGGWLASLAAYVSVKVPLLVGAQEITRVLALKLNPVGRPVSV